jgi:hypothetical protein
LAVTLALADYFALVFPARHSYFSAGTLAPGTVFSSPIENILVAAAAVVVAVGNIQVTDVEIVADRVPSQAIGVVTLIDYILVRLIVDNLLCRTACTAVVAAVVAVVTLVDCMWTRIVAVGCSLYIAVSCNHILAAAVAVDSRTDHRIQLALDTFAGTAGIR